jgi:immune inhibitor A
MKNTIRKVPPAPHVMASLFAQYKKARLNISFKKYLESIGFVDPALTVVGMDDTAHHSTASAAGPELILVPSIKVSGELRVKVLLVDFSDKPGTLSKEHYENILFSKDTYPTGSMMDYYSEVSLGKVSLKGSVHGWLRMPQPYAYYTFNGSGTDAPYPHNAQRLAEDAVTVALANGVTFEPQLDKLNQGIITALFIIHAGRGAEEIVGPQNKQEIWSHKWALRNPITVAPNLMASIYLTVPNDCKVGVCAHELGHLAFQWEDFYDPNYDQDGSEWDGSGVWDLMAGGSWNNGGITPAHPAGIHKSQHGWVTMETLKKSKTISLKPFTKKYGKVIKVISTKYKPKQYLLLENRTRKGFDFHLPGEGLLVWRVDESKEQVSSFNPALLLLQADGRHDLEKPDDWNAGDAGDPFPGKSRKVRLSDAGKVSTNFPGGKKSGITISMIRFNQAKGELKFKITIK